MNACIAILLEHLPLLSILMAYIGAGFILQSTLDQGALIHLEWSYDISVLLIYLFLFYIVFFVWFQVLIELSPKEGFAGLSKIFKEIRERYLSWKEIGSFLVVLTVISLSLSIYSSLKQAIPMIYPFSFDKTFMMMDFLLHLGHHPWRLLQAFMGYPKITKFMDYIYTSWYLVLSSVVLWQAWSSRRRLRAQFFIGLLLLFIFGGTILATLFSSAGPCYYHYTVAGSGNPYQSQMLYLGSIHAENFLYSVEGQKKLWLLYTEGIKMPYVGISAMPSIHVGVAVLLAILGWRTNKILGLGFTIYAFLIQLGSVHLGWHYAIDGYFSAILTLVLWKGSGWFVMTLSEGGGSGISNRGKFRYKANSSIAEKHIGTNCV